LWEDVIYGASEGMLLSVLPVLVLWQMSERLGWTAGWDGKLGAGALAFAGSSRDCFLWHSSIRREGSLTR
jgi:hypothetical protein